MKHYNEGRGAVLFDGLNYTLMVLLCVAMLYPLLNTLSVSLSEPDMISQGKVGWFPRGFNLEGYKYIFAEPRLGLAYGNTIAYAVTGTFVMLLLTSLMAYPLAMQGFVLKTFITIFLAITLFFNGGMIPTYLNIRNLHLLDTFWVMVLPGAISAFNVIIFRTFFQSIPKDLRESSFMDGANDIRIMFNIYLPLSKPLLATFALFGVVGVWNSWFEALIYLNNDMKHPIQILLRKMISETDTSTLNAQTQLLMSQRVLHSKNIKMATVMVTILPILLLYPYLQKHFVSGMMIGSIKG